MKFSVNDRVKILQTATSVGVEAEEVGKVGTITNIYAYTTSWCGYKIQMDNICKARGHKPKWNIGTEMMELLPKKNEQLLFDFML